MRAVRYLYVLALALWLGGMVLAGAVVAPALFRGLEASQGLAGRMLAGDLFGAILSRLYVVGAVAAGVMFFALTLQRIIGPRPRSYGIRVGFIVLMFALTAYAAAILQPRIEALQQQAGGPIVQLAATNPLRTEFDRLHSLSTTLMSLTIGGALLLLFWETRE